MQRTPYVEAAVTYFVDDSLPLAAGQLLAQLKNTATDLIRQLSPLTKTAGTPFARLETYITRADRSEAGQLADLCLVAFDVRREDKIAVLGTTDVRERVEKVLELLTRQLGILQVSKKVNQNVTNKLTKQQRE
jgi:ATP-dependent Lon protease